LVVTTVGGSSNGLSSTPKTLALPTCVIVPDPVCGSGTATAVVGSRTVSFTIDGADTVTRINWGDTYTTADPALPATHLYAYDSTYAIRWTVLNAANKEAQCGPVYHKVSSAGTKHKVSVTTTEPWTAIKVWLGTTVKANGGSTTGVTWTSGNLNSAPGYVVQLLKYRKTFTCTGGTPTAPGVTPAGWIVDLSTADAALTCTVNP
jgi:hypothetical protein